MTVTDEVNSLDASTTRWSFEYLGILGAVAGVVALGSMAMYLAERRRERAVAAAMLGQMGVPTRWTVTAAAVEMSTLVGVAAAAGAIAAWTTARRMFPRFEPEPNVPPHVAIGLDLLAAVAVIAPIVAVVAVIAGLAERSAGRAQRAEVLRG